MFETIKVDSVVGSKRIRFSLEPEMQNSIVGKRETRALSGSPSTIISLSDLRPEQRGRVRPSSYLKDLALHFFPQYISGTLPRVSITFDVCR